MKDTTCFSLIFPIAGIALEGFQTPEGVTWFQGKSTCDVLGQTNPTRYIQAYCDEAHTTNVVYGRGRPQCFVLEPAVYDLMFESKTEGAKAFKKWIAHVVLPNIRESGAYISPTASLAQLASAKEAIALLEEKAKAKVQSQGQ